MQREHRNLCSNVNSLFHKINTSCHYESWSENADFHIVKNKGYRLNLIGPQKGLQQSYYNILINIIFFKLSPVVFS
jgi:hypothetical protein